MDFLTETKKLWSMGFSIIWLYPKSKRPIGDKWTEGPRIHWDTLEKLYRNAQNVGVRLGETSKFADGSYLCVLDCDVKSTDPHHLKEMELALYNFCPSSDFAPRVHSGRGGGSCHLYFRTKTPQVSFKALHSSHKVKVFMPSQEPSKVDRDNLTEDEIKKGLRWRLAWEVDVFGQGKQVVLPPSVHPDSLKPYRWEVPLNSYESIPLLAEGFAPKKVRLASKGSNEIKFKPVDLLSTPINDKYFDLITSGKGFNEYPSRSEALFASLNALVNAGLDDAQIFTVLTDRSYFMSEKPLEAGRGDVDTAARWLQSQIAKIRDERSAQAAFEGTAIVDDLDEIFLSDEEAAAQAEDLVPWINHLKVTSQGLYKNTAYNLYLILKNGAHEPIWAYDEFKNSLVYSGKAPWNASSDIGREIRDSDDVDVKMWLSKEWGIEASTQAISEVTMKLALENSFHPVRRYLRGLKWDGKPRIDNWLFNYMSATCELGQEEYVQAVGRKVLCAAVARVLDPGVKFDYMLILEGKQGVGKSSAVGILAGEWFADSLGDIESKDVVDVMRGKWIVEVGELASMDKATTNSMKLFVSRTTDTVRKAYDRRAADYPRQCIFIGTTNDQQYLKDESGARRFWPVSVGKVNFAKLEEDRDQLWAEALVRYEDDFEPLYIDKQEIRSVAEDVAGARYVEDSLENDVVKVLGSEKLGECFTITRLWAVMRDLMGPITPPDVLTQKRLAKALTRNGYVSKRVESVKGKKISLWGPPDFHDWAKYAKKEAEFEE